MKPVLLNDFPRQWDEIGPAVLGAVERVGASGWYVLGKEVRAFEEELAQFWGVSQVAGVASGLDALEIAMRVAGVQPGDAVLTTPLSAFATTLAIVRVGGKPVFCDTDANGQMDFDLAEEVLRNSPWVRFVVPVHLFGHCLDLPRLDELQKRCGVTVIEDCAQSVGAAWRGRAAGTVGLLAATSFYPTKNLGAMGDGGALLSNNAELLARARQLRDYGQSAKYRHDEVGWNSRLDELHAAILRDAALPRLREWTRRRQEVAARYAAEILHPDVRALRPPPGSESVEHLYPVLVPAGQRQSFEAWLKSQGISSGQHYPILIPDQQAMRGVPFEVRGELAEARKLANGEVSLPIHPQLSEEDIERVIQAVNSWNS